MLTLIATLFIATFLAFIDLFFTQLCAQPFIFCTLGYYIITLYTYNPYKKLLIIFFTLMIIGHFLYGNELLIMWYLVPLTIAGSLGQKFMFSQKYQPALLLLIGMLIHRFFIDHMSPLTLITGDYTSVLSLATLILVALISLK